MNESPLMPLVLLVFLGFFLWGLFEVYSHIAAISPWLLFL